MTKINALTNVVENTKDKEVKVAKVPCTPTRMKPCDLDKTFEGSAFRVINNHEFTINHKNLAGVLTQMFWSLLCVILL
jgi:hypothetical protein